MSKNRKNPVVLFAYRRADMTQAVLSKILNYDPPRLYLVHDGLLKPEHESEWTATRLILDQVSFHRVVRIYSEVNLGLRDRFFSALDKVFSEESRAIILEDDTLPSDGFFSFMDEMLDLYEHNPTISIVSGHNFAPIDTGFSHFYSKASYIWGWSTWARVWQDFSPEKRISKSSPEQIKSIRATYSSLFEKYLFERMLRRLHSLKTWDVPFSFYLRQKSLLSVVSSSNLIQNLGLGDGATNTKWGLLGAYNSLQEPSRLPPPPRIEVIKSHEKRMWRLRALRAIAGFTSLANLWSSLALSRLRR